MDLVKVNQKSRKRLGRGLSAGGGKTAGRGTKGQKSRSGHNIPRRFEGGQTALSMRLPILPGFKSHKPKAEVISLDIISANFKDGDTVSATSLDDKGIVKFNTRCKILANGKLTVKVSLDESVQASATTKKLFESTKPNTEEKVITAKKATTKKATAQKTPKAAE